MIGLVVYLVGVVLSYLLGRSYSIYDNKKNKRSYIYSKDDRFHMIGFSLVSWLTVIVFVLMHFGKPSKNGNDEASW